MLTAAAVVLAVLAGTYQPVQFGGYEGGAGSFLGLPSGTVQTVNDFGMVGGQFYAPPQDGVFTLVESIADVGPEPVTIKAVSILSPTDQASGRIPWPLTPAGQVHWRLMVTGSAVKGPISGADVAGITLTPDNPVIVGIPMRLSGECYDPNGWEEIDTFWVQEQFGPFTHWVAVAMPKPLLMHAPNFPGGEPGNHLLCPARGTR